MTAVPAFIPPELARLTTTPPLGREWVHEIKFDGYRMQLRVAEGKAKLFTRKGLDWTAKFPEIAEEGARLPDCIIDGEICAVDAKGVSDFGLLQNALSEQKTGGLVFYVFDCLYADGQVLKDRPLQARKLALQSVLKGGRLKRIHFVSHFSVESGDLLEAACRLDLEGIISKRLDGHYISGRNGDWTK
ncbi:MAG TPA: DNA ligase, partial [Rhizomicrobium sp.]|nr:DNA ligase [Rhizomicrobium sp.]